MKKAIQGFKVTVPILLGGLAVITIIISELYLFDVLWNYKCGNYNRKADDVISRAVYEAVGAKELHYGGKEKIEEINVVRYEYYIVEEKEGLIETAVEAVNKVLEQEDTDVKVAILFRKSIPSGVETVFKLCNYREDSDSDVADFEKLQYLRILGTHMTSNPQESIYNNPAVYQNFKDILYLKASQKIQDAADEQGIDWHEYWPELEEVQVYPGD